MTRAITKGFCAFTSMFGWWIAGLVILGSCVLLQGCAAVPEPFHQLHDCNVGTAALTAVKIQYGKVVWPMFPLNGLYRGGDTKCLGSGSISDSMPIPVTMYVTWTTEGGQEHSASIPVRGKLKSNYPLNTIEVRFNNDHVEVFEIVRPIAMRELEFRLYP